MIDNPIHEFSKRIVAGARGFRSHEECELAVYPDRDVAIAEWTIRCLAYPECEDSEKILTAILERRKELCDPIIQIGKSIRHTVYSKKEQK